ncbi:ASI1-immunoprecipitated protein 3 [Cardamine amara subsp. amara]|uniref:ASI1-immunoprecipitated protein 3 n=1 Tax=Cardamine amara subsp. amara TaxID=228776 RepID=A0ABD1A463_CARAN
MEMKQINWEKDNEEMSLKKKTKLEWRPEDYAHTDGRWIKFTGEGVNKKFHYETFEFHGQEYGLEDTVVCHPEKATQRPYIAIIKDIYKQGKERYVKLEVNWFYRPEDLAKKYVRNWESKDSGDLVYSFHRDEVSAESVMHKCLVYFVPENEELPNPRASPDFIVRKFYDHIKKKLLNFSHRGFNVKQKDEINLLVEKTISRVGDLFTIEKVEMSKISRRKKSVPKRHILTAERTMHERSTSNGFYDESICNNFEDGEASRELYNESIQKNFEIGGASITISSDLDREKRVEELMEALKQAGDYDVFPVVQALEHALYDSLADDIPMYNYKVEYLLDKLKRGFSFDEIKAGSFEEPKLEESVASTSTIVEPKILSKAKK